MTAPVITVAERHAALERCRAIVARALGLPRGEVTADAHFAQDLNADSLDRVTIAMEIEDEFGIDVPDDVAAECETVRDMVDALMERLHQPAAGEG